MDWSNQKDKSQITNNPQTFENEINWTTDTNIELENSTSKTRDTAVVTNDVSIAETDAIEKAKIKPMMLKKGVNRYCMSCSVLNVKHI